MPTLCVNLCSLSLLADLAGASQMGPGAPRPPGIDTSLVCKSGVSSETHHTSKES